MSGGDPIVVASCTDEGYLPFALVVANSMARHATSGRPVTYHVFYDGPDHWAVDKLQTFRRGSLTVTVHRISNPWRHLGTINNFPPSTYLRLDLPQLLPGTERVIYLDLDLIVLTDLAPLFDFDLGDKAVAGVPCVLTLIPLVSDRTIRSGGREINRRRYLAEELGLTTHELQMSYLQAGVLLMDLQKLREMNFSAKAGEIVETMRDRLAFCDQCAINKLVAGRSAKLPPRWNVPPFSLGIGAILRAPAEFQQHVRQQRHPAILHFGGAKPWHELAVPGTLRWLRQVPGSGATAFVLRRLRRDWPHQVRPLLRRTPRQLREGFRVVGQRMKTRLRQLR